MLQKLSTLTIVVALLCMVSWIPADSAEVVLAENQTATLFGGGPGVVNGKCCLVIDACKTSNPGPCSNYNGDPNGCEGEHPYHETAYAYGCISPANACTKCDCTDYAKDANGAAYNCITWYFCEYNDDFDTCTKGSASGTKTPGVFSCADNCP